jgi:hypothetical protein
MIKVRELMESWFSRYPEKCQSELRARFRSPDDIQHKGAFFELYMHALLAHLGYGVEAHPAILTAPTRPEFLVHKEGIPVFYLEATLAAGPSDETAADKRESVVYETIDKMHSPNFYIGVKLEKSTTKAPPGRKWRERLEIWLSGLDPDDIDAKRKSGGLVDLPSLTLEHEGWRVAFHAIPKSPKARGKPGVRPIGVRDIPFQECKQDDWVRNAIKEKATKYGNLKLPYVIAINVLSIFSNDNLMIMDALFGDEQITSYFMPGGISHDKPTRAPNGAFQGPKGPRNTRVSGVVVSNDLSCFGIAKINPVLWHNPWAEYQIDSGLWPFPQWVLNESKTRIVPRSGRDARELFGLPKEWPMLGQEKDFE